MKAKSAIAFLFLSLIMGLPVRLGGQAITSSSENVLEAMPKDLEVRLALSALPPYLMSSIRLRDMPQNKKDERFHVLRGEDRLGPRGFSK
jgi:hypothetical protein